MRVFEKTASQGDKIFKAEAEWPDSATKTARFVRKVIGNIIPQYPWRTRRVHTQLVLDGCIPKEISKPNASSKVKRGASTATLPSGHNLTQVVDPSLQAGTRT